MVASGAVMEVLVDCAVKHIQTLTGVGCAVGVHHVQQHRNAHLVGSIDQMLQILGCAESGGSGEEVADLIAKGWNIRPEKFTGLPCER